MKKRIAIKTVKEVESAVGMAETYAAEHGLPVTIERIACFLGVSRNVLMRIAEGKEEESADVSAAVAKAFDESVAAVMEYGLTKGITSSMPVFYLKSNAGYSERSEEVSGFGDVIFLNGDKI